MITIYGASDDLIEVEGDIREEFNLHDDEQGDLLAFSDGTVLRVQYTRAGIWRITPVASGTAAVRIDICPEDEGYSDRAHLNGDVAWVVHGTRHVTAKRTQPVQGGNHLGSHRA